MERSKSERDVMKNPTAYQVQWLEKLAGHVMSIEGRHFLYQPYNGKWWLHEGGDDCPIGYYLKTISVTDAIERGWIELIDDEYRVTDGGEAAIRRYNDPI